MNVEIGRAARSAPPRSPASNDVRDFYERMPYPAPLTNLEKHRDLYGNPERRRALCHLIRPTERPRPNQKILIAGCGTSQAARYALREPDAQITAIDISGTSLGHTRELQQKYDLRNLELHQLSILNVESLGRTFDHIVCTGVLHHLVDPDLGLQSLLNVLEPDGAMQIMVYASYGRVGIYMLQSYCRLLGITPSSQELEDLSIALKDLPDDHPLAHLLRKSKDFQRPDALADALLHPQDRSFTVPQVYEWLERCGMSLGRWFEQAPYLPQCGLMAKIPHAAQLNSLPEAAQHAAVELFRGSITQHNFVAYRRDRTTPSQPIHFSGEQWRKYIPIRLPWTVCIRDRVPPGSVAVLLNRAHKHSDLILPIDAKQSHIFDQIDGIQTLDEIAQHSGSDDACMLQLFQQLWHYDQIVFDASHTT